MKDNEHRILAAISYLGFLFLIPLVASKHSPLAQFHAKQGMVLFIVELVAAAVPVVGWALNVVLLVLAIYAAVQALQGRMWEIPVIGSWAKKINF